MSFTTQKETHINKQIRKLLNEVFKMHDAKMITTALASEFIKQILEGQNFILYNNKDKELLEKATYLMFHNFLNSKI